MKQRLPVFALIVTAFIAGAFSHQYLTSVTNEDVQAAAKVAGLEMTNH